MGAVFSIFLELRALITVLMKIIIGKKNLKCLSSPKHQACWFIDWFILKHGTIELGCDCWFCIYLAHWLSKICSDWPFSSKTWAQEQWKWTNTCAFLWVVDSYSLPYSLFYMWRIAEVSSAAYTTSCFLFLQAFTKDTFIVIVFAAITLCNPNLTNHVSYLQASI